MAWPALAIEHASISVALPADKRDASTSYHSWFLGGVGMSAIAIASAILLALWAGQAASVPGGLTNRPALALAPSPTCAAMRRDATTFTACLTTTNYHSNNQFLLLLHSTHAHPNKRAPAIVTSAIAIAPAQRLPQTAQPNANAQAHLKWPALWRRSRRVAVGSFPSPWASSQRPRLML